MRSFKKHLEYLKSASDKSVVAKIFTIYFDFLLTTSIVFPFIGMIIEIEQSDVSIFISPR